MVKGIDLRWEGGEGGTVHYWACSVCGLGGGGGDPHMPTPLPCRKPLACKSHHRHLRTGCS